MPPPIRLPRNGTSEPRIVPAIVSSNPASVSTTTSPSTGRIVASRIGPRTKVLPATVAIEPSACRYCPSISARGAFQRWAFPVQLDALDVARLQRLHVAGMFLQEIRQPVVERCQDEQDLLMRFA